MYISVSGSKSAINLDYSYALKEKVLRPLLRDGADGVQESLNILRDYSLLREDLDSLNEITGWPLCQDLFSKIDSKVCDFMHFLKTKYIQYSPLSVVSYVTYMTPVNGIYELMRKIYQIKIWKKCFR